MKRRESEKKEAKRRELRLQTNKPKGTDSGCIHRKQ